MGFTEDSEVVVKELDDKNWEVRSTIHYVGTGGDFVFPWGCRPISRPCRGRSSGSSHATAATPSRRSFTITCAEADRCPGCRSTGSFAIPWGTRRLLSCEGGSCGEQSGSVLPSASHTTGSAGGRPSCRSLAPGSCDTRCAHSNGSDPRWAPLVLDRGACVLRPPEAQGCPYARSSGSSQSSEAAAHAVGMIVRASTSFGLETCRGSGLADSQRNLRSLARSRWRTAGREPVRRKPSPKRAGRSAPEPYNSWSLAFTSRSMSPRVSKFSLVISESSIAAPSSSLMNETAA